VRPPIETSAPPSAADEPTPAEPKKKGFAGAFFVSLGIMATKVFGVVRNAFIAKYLGTTGAADAFNAATRIPNLLQNLFGEGALSASFIPVYSRLRAEGDEKEAGVVAGGVLLTLALVISVTVALGILFTPQLLPLLAGGLKNDTREMAIAFVRIVFPGMGVLVLSAWCLGVLNSHRRFFLSYAAPVAWSAVMIAAFWYYGRQGLGVERIARIGVWAYVVGAIAQFAVQIPSVTGLVGKRLRLRTSWSNPNVRTVLRNFVPVGISRGIVQISNYVDIAISSYLPLGTLSLLTYATTISYVPVSMFGIGISAAELPEMSSVLGSDEERFRQLRERLTAGLRHIAFFVIPSALAMVAAGDVMASALFEHGVFPHENIAYIWGILAGSAVGLLASTSGRLYSSTYYALHDTRTPLKFAIVRVILTSILGFVFAVPVPRMLGLDGHWGGAGLTISFGIAGWCEYMLLRRSLAKRIGQTGVPVSFSVRLWISAVVAGAGAFGVKLILPHWSSIVTAIIVLGEFGLVYLAATLLMKVPESTILLRRLRLAR
jgi:putative peptidoglycan lipid II flippase